MVMAPVVQAKLVAVAELSATDRGTGGFGSTGR
jgi:dUTP pyrophosphatase